MELTHFSRLETNRGAPNELDEAWVNAIPKHEIEWVHNLSYE